MWHPAHDSHASGDEGLAHVAAMQHGVVSRAQLEALGLGRGAIAHRVARGRLHRVHPCVFSVGHPRLTPRGRLFAGVFAAGPGAVLSHRSAADLWDLRPSARARPDVIAPTHRRTPGVDVHRCRLADGDVAEHEGLPCTTVVRTLVDLADVVPPDHVRRAVVRADMLRIVDFAALTDAVGRACGRRGQGVLGTVLADHTAEAIMTRSELEQRMLALLRRTGLPTPLVNAPVETPEQAYLADFLWPEHRLIVETDGFAVHGTRTAFEADRRRDAALQVAGYRVVRFTWRQIRDEPRRVARTIRALLAGGAAPDA